MCFFSTQMRKREVGCNQLLSLSALQSVTPNWKAGCSIKPKHQLHLKIPGPNVGSIKSLLASLRNQKVESRVRAQASLLALLFGRRSAPDTDTDTHLCQNLLPGLGKACGRKVAQAMQSIWSERQNTKKGWPWVEWPDLSLYFLSNPRDLDLCCFSHKAGIFTYICKRDLPVVRTSGNLAELVRT